jgi:hypothetical protein
MLSIPGFSSMFLYKRWYRCNVDMKGFYPPFQDIQPTWCDFKDEEFLAKFDKPCKPALFQNLIQNKWPSKSE